MSSGHQSPTAFNDASQKYRATKPRRSTTRSNPEFTWDPPDAPPLQDVIRIFRQLEATSTHPHASPPPGSKAARTRRAPGRSLALSIQEKVNEMVRKILPSNAGPTSSRICVVTHAHEGMSTNEFAHIITPAFPEELLDKLEWAWGMERFQFKLDDPKNIHPMSIDIHRRFDLDAGFWFWSAIDFTIVANMAQHYTRQKSGKPFSCSPYTFYSEPSTTFRYSLVATKPMKDYWHIRRYIGYPHSFSSDTTTPPDVEQHVYPFTSLLPVDLYVPLHFVIVNTGEKLHRMYKDVAQGALHRQITSDFPQLIPATVLTLIDMYTVYVAWITSTPPPEWMDPPKTNAASPCNPGDRGRHGTHRGEHAKSLNHGSSATSADVAYREAQTQGVNYGAQRMRASDLTPYYGDVPRNVGNVNVTSDDEEPSDEDEEWEDEEYFQGMEKWADDVLRETSGCHPDSDSSSGDEEQSLVLEPTRKDSTTFEEHANADAELSSSAFREGSSSQDLIEDKQPKYPTVLPW